ncbi:MarR family winged helix-turn-helix transcriptional regulator [Leeia oryzae]|uniref:MarR family winged helix-turn-helix transcriptional regulator n=1 Tax=Leeia oryzae TaxID=356662 RepID=UPI00035DA5DB|nr:MarR family transcriptional regulator [Leeia oryzae]
MNTLDRNLLQQLGRTTRCMYAAFEREVGHGLPRTRILFVLNQLQMPTQKQLADRLAIDPAAMTRQIKQMEADGLVSRQTDATDNRQTRVMLTPAGQQLLQSMQPARERFLDKSLDGIAEADLATVEKVLKLLEQRFATMRDAVG